MLCISRLVLVNGNRYLGILYSYGIAVNHELDTLKTMNSSYRNTTTLTSLLLPCWLQ